MKISPEYPKVKWRGFFATVETCYEGDDDTCGVSITLDGPMRSDGHKTKYREIKHSFLVPTGERIPPERVPRPAITWRGNGDKGLRPAHEFSIIDEIEQYFSPRAEQSCCDGGPLSRAVWSGRALG